MPPLATTPTHQEGTTTPDTDQRGPWTRPAWLIVVPACVTALLGAAAGWIAASDIVSWARISAVLLAIAVITTIVIAQRRATTPPAGDELPPTVPAAEPEPPAAEATPPPSERQDALRAGFANLAHRLQTLIHQAISSLDQLERQVEDPDLLEAFFKLDHLVTRMLRQAESLAVLGGEPLQRQATHLVHVHGLQRSALSEIEHYQRVSIAQVPEGVAVRGHVLGEIIHLLAELLENATSYSSPNAAKVRVGAETVPNGLSLWVEDRGIGIDDRQRQRLNELIATPGAVDLGELLNDGRIGLATVAEIADRHGIHVRLDSNIFGGTLAWVVLPHTLLDTPASQPTPPAPPAPRTTETAPVAETPHRDAPPPPQNLSYNGDPLPVRGRSDGNIHRHQAAKGTDPAPVQTGWDAVSPPDASAPVWPDNSLSDTAQHNFEAASSTPPAPQQQSPKHARPPLPKRTPGQLPPELYRQPTNTAQNAEASPDLMGAFWGGELDPPPDTPSDAFRPDHRTPKES